MKLRRNSEARRAVVAQALAYAAYLHGLTLEELERRVLANHLAKRDHETLAGAVAAEHQEGDFDEAGFEEALALDLAAGRVRLVFVLDDTRERLSTMIEEISTTALVA